MAAPMKAASSARLAPSAVAWAAFEGFRNPVIVLVSIYVFVPYVVASVAPNPVRGQEMIATAGQWAGWIVALTAPLLGVVIDRLGRRKPAQAALILLMVPLVAALWFVTPGGPIPFWMIVAMVAGYNMLFAWIELIHNTLLTTAARGQIARTSGLGLALGNGVSVLALVAVLWMFALPGTVDLPFVPDKPLFGLDTSQHEQARIVAPITAALLLVGLALVLFGVPDAPPSGVPFGVALSSGWRDLRSMVGELRREPNAARFLLARMLFADGQNMIVGFGGVLAVGLMRWNTLELLAFGVILSVIAVGGGLLAGWLDETIGPKKALILETAGSSLILLGLLLTGPGRIAGIYVPDGRWWNGPVFQDVSDLGYLGLSCFIAVTVTAAYASARTMLTQVVPPERIGTFFGLFALSGTATGWLGPAMLAAATAATQSQRLGFATVLLLLISGLLLMFTVKAPTRR